ncbi:MAG: ATP-dependent zinc protease [Flavobacteriales bacterium]|jgi:hypothetical protein
MSKSHPPLQIIGRREKIDLPDLGVVDVVSKIDTGAFRTALHCEACRVVRNADGDEILETVFDLDGKGEKVFRFKKFTIREVKSSFGQSETRYCIKTKLRIGGRDIRSEVTLTDRSGMKYQVLIGRKTLLKKFLVDVNQVFLLSKH